MNVVSRNMLFAGLVVVALMALFPAWVRCEIRWIQRPNSNTFEGAAYHRSAEYAFVLTPPTTADQTDASFIDLPRLAIQWAVVAAVTAGVLAWSGRKKGEATSGG